MRKFEFKKLVRDKIVESIISVGNKPNWKTLSDSEYVMELKKKIIEEASEMARSSKREEIVKELADIQEIIDNLLEVLKISKMKFAEIQRKKNKERGSFKRKQYIDSVETSDEVTEWVQYYLDNSGKYPELKIPLDADTKIILIAKINTIDHKWIVDLLVRQWGSVNIVSRGRSLDASRLPGLKAVFGNENVGLLTYHINKDQCEVVSLDSLVEGRGIGTMLLEEVKKLAKKAKCKRVWLITTNDNLNALRFYQKRGFAISAIYPNALDLSRKLKPKIPKLGFENIPLRDEIELEFKL